MEGLNSYFAFWVIYLAAGTLGYWCWGKMAFWVTSRGLPYHLFSALGAVIVFTPVPVAAESSFLAPGAVVIAFSLISGTLAELDYTAIWYAASVATAFGITLIMALAGLLPTDMQTTAEKPAKPRSKTRSDNPFR
ncbi:hypothetical protein [Thalassolituus sp.]|jgi:hypothetical protein|uniref:hypothetical protein n=1 Tax=Thalassolituus sp. TaxID=2030822 RepID=UPI0035119BCE